MSKGREVCYGEEGSLAYLMPNKAMLARLDEANESRLVCPPSVKLRVGRSNACYEATAVDAVPEFAATIIGRAGMGGRARTRCCRRGA